MRRRWQSADRTSTVRNHDQCLELRKPNDARPNGQRISCYDGLQRKLRSHQKEDLAMPEVNYFWDEIEDNVIEEYDENGNTIVEYTTEPTLYGSVLSQDRGGQVRHYHYDGQGNTVSLTDDAGNVTDTRKYSAFGEVTESTGTTVFPYQYGAQWGYAADGVMYSIRRRHLAFSTGRWTSCDTVLSILDINGYTYARSSPTRFIDPSGEVPIECLCELHLETYSLYIKIVNCTGTAVTCCQKACSGIGSAWTGKWRIKQPDPRYTGGFKICQRDINAETIVEKCANKCGGSHTFIMFGPVDTSGKPLPGTVGVGWAGDPPNWENAFRPSACTPLCRTATPLKNGKGAGTPGNAATSDQILDCLKNTLANRKFVWYWTNCHWWAYDVAVPA